MSAIAPRSSPRCARGAPSTCWDFGEPFHWALELIPGFYFFEPKVLEAQLLEAADGYHIVDPPTGGWFTRSDLGFRANDRSRQRTYIRPHSIAYTIVLDAPEFDVAQHARWIVEDLYDVTLPRLRSLWRAETLTAHIGREGNWLPPLPGEPFPPMHLQRLLDRIALFADDDTVAAWADKWPVPCGDDDGCHDAMFALTEELNAEYLPEDERLSVPFREALAEFLGAHDEFAELFYDEEDGRPSPFAAPVWIECRAAAKAIMALADEQPVLADETERQVRSASA